MSSSPQKVKRFAEVSIAIMLVLGVVTIALAPFTGHYRGFYLSIFLGAIVVIASVVYLPLVHAKKAEDFGGIGVSAIQSLWISTSMGLGYVVTALAPYFNINFPAAVALFVIGWVMLVYGGYALLRISKECKVPLSV
jgi:cobalamin synthase